MKLDSKIPEGPIAEKWTNHKNHLKLVAPNNRPKIDVIVVGTGLAGASAAASLGEMGYNVKAFCFQDSPRRAHSIAAQGGINAAKNYQNDGDSTYRLFYDTIKGGDYRAREANVHRLAEVSSNIIDQCVAQGVPFARDYGGMLDNRSFGGTQVQRTFYALGKQWLKEKYGNLFTMYQKITDENPYETPMKIYPAVHYTMGGVWVDYHLQSSIPGCFVAGEANFSDHGANRLGASALMQGLADGYFVLPYTVSNYLADEIKTGKISTETQEFVDAENKVKETINKFLETKGSKSVDHFHKRLGLIM